jgi:hypothetical protein
MAKIEKVTICLGLGGLFAILMGISSAQPLSQSEGPMGPDLALDHGCPEGCMHKEGILPMGVPVEVIVGGGGFALQDNETHLFRLSVVRLSPLEPGRIRDFLVSNKSIEEIKEAIKAEEGEALYRGSMRLDDTVYPLANIDVNPSENGVTIIDADIALPGSDPANQTSVAGHLAVKVSASKTGSFGEGQLDMNSTEHRGNYQVLLDMAGHATPFGKIRNHTAHETAMELRLQT